MLDKFIQNLLIYLFHVSPYIVWSSFLVENALIVSLVLITGRTIQKIYTPDAIAYSYTSKEWFICSVTTILNTIVTYLGFWLWKQGFIEFQIFFSLYVVVDFILVFLSMDLLMYVFHFFIHKTSLHKAMHHLHHQSVDPKPIDLFVLHPIETICFGTLWIGLLLIYPFNFYSIIIYLIVNVIFGLIGHLGLEPIPINVRAHYLVKFLGTSTFHHQHHQNVNYNFGFYTSIWDRLFGTLKR